MPGNIPVSIEIDVTELAIGDQLRVEDIPLPDRRRDAGRARRRRRAGRGAARRHRGRGREGEEGEGAEGEAAEAAAEAPAGESRADGAGDE